MGNSIQDYLKKINSSITIPDVLSLFATLVILSGTLLYAKVTAPDPLPVRYIYGELNTSETGENLPFGSKSGKTYTYSWCGGSSSILPKNKVYFTSEQDAIAKGRILSKLCGK